MTSQIPFNTSSLRCLLVWPSQDYILRYAKIEPDLWSLVLSAPNTNAYVAMGFSEDGKMVGASAVVGWFNGSSVGTIKQYYLGGEEEEKVVPDQGKLTLINASTTIVSKDSRLYLAFQVRVPALEPRIIYSVGPRNGVPSSNNVLSEHRDQVSTYFDYANGKSKEVNLDEETLKIGHGIVNIVGWTVLLPIGALLARRLKKYEPLWFYIHAATQTLGFSAGLAGVVMGLVLEDRIDPENITTHKVIGIIVLALGVIQVMALIARPAKESKRRKYWNWYHHSVGRVCIAMAVGNVFYGIEVGGQNKSWYIGYGVYLGVWVLFCVVVEVIMCSRK
ncbi:hypothetical protein QJS04_geneDACA015537 [Acorus gramineus]|uniref:Cytochrome b561 and DOMON domain-containing protein n=1 Tax=Acorus gramineus TaxID=55184 RepID=A0AAV9AQP8_ACOGR|nr:hypothetical protein QJS04_geneDACA015537 [Acorus gramineus]